MQCNGGERTERESSWKPLNFRIFKFGREAFFIAELESRLIRLLHCIFKLNIDNTHSRSDSRAICTFFIQFSFYTPIRLSLCLLHNAHTTDLLTTVRCRLFAETRELLGRKSSKLRENDTQQPPKKTWAMANFQFSLLVFPWELFTNEMKNLHRIERVGMTQLEEKLSNFRRN